MVPVVGSDCIKSCSKRPPCCIRHHPILSINFFYFKETFPTLRWLRKVNMGQNPPGADSRHSRFVRPAATTAQHRTGLHARSRQVDGRATVWIEDMVIDQAWHGAAPAGRYSDLGQAPRRDPCPTIGRYGQPACNCLLQPLGLEHHPPAGTQSFPLKLAASTYAQHCIWTTIIRVSLTPGKSCTYHQYLEHIRKPGKCRAFSTPETTRPS